MTTLDLATPCSNEDYDGLTPQDKAAILAEDAALAAAEKASLTRAAKPCLRARCLKALLDAQTASEAAKSTAANGVHFDDYDDGSRYARSNYRRSRRAREDRYEQKEAALALAVSLSSRAKIPCGYKDGVLYFDLPTGQASFHSARHGAPDYAAEWDGQKGASAPRIAAAVKAYLSSPLFISSAAFDAAEAAAEEEKEATKMDVWTLRRTERRRQVCAAVLKQLRDGGVYRLDGGIKRIWDAIASPDYGAGVIHPVVTFAELEAAEKSGDTKRVETYRDLLGVAKNRPHARSKKEWFAKLRVVRANRRRQKIEALGGSVRCGEVKIGTREFTVKLPVSSWYGERPAEALYLGSGYKTPAVKGYRAIRALVRDVLRNAPYWLIADRAQREEQYVPNLQRAAVKQKLATVAKTKAIASLYSVPNRSKLSTGELHAKVADLIKDQVAIYAFDPAI